MVEEHAHREGQLLVKGLGFRVSVNLMPQTLARIFVESFLWVRAQCLGIGILGGLDESLRVSEGWSFVNFFASRLGG